MFYHAQKRNKQKKKKYCSHFQKAVRNILMSLYSPFHLVVVEFQLTYYYKFSVRISRMPFAGDSRNFSTSIQQDMSVFLLISQNTSRSSAHFLFVTPTEKSHKTYLMYGIGLQT